MEKKKKIYLKDIAEKVGVSITLVSYVLNNKNLNRISKEVAEEIRKTARELNYQPNLIAKSLRTNKTYTICLIAADISNPFFSHIAKIIEDEAAKQGYTVVFASSDEDKSKLKHLINVFLNRQIDGFILAAVEGAEDDIDEIEKLNIPLVLIDRFFPEKNYNYVVIDNFQAAYSAVSHLLENGYERIGLITYETSLFHLKERERGFRGALKAKGISPDQKWIQEVGIDSIKEDIEKGIDNLLSLERRVDGLFFTSNKLALSGLKYLRKMDIKIPKTIAIVGFDQSEAFDLFYSPITYVKQPLEEIGKRAVQNLMEIMNDKEDQGQIKTVLETSLIVQKSSKMTV